MIRYLKPVDKERLQQELMRTASRMVIEFVQTGQDIINKALTCASELDCSTTSNLKDLLQENTERARTHFLEPLVDGLGRLAVNTVLEGAHLVREAQTACQSLRNPDANLSKLFPSLNSRAELQGILNSPSPERALAKILPTLNPLQKLSVATTLCDRSFWATELVTEEMLKKVHAGVRAKMIGMSVASAMADAENAKFLTGLVANTTELLQPEAMRIIRSLTLIRQLEQPVHLSVVFAMYGEQPNLQPSPAKNDLDETIFQLQQVAALTPKLLWNLIGVCDGDDRKDEDPLRCITSAEAAENILRLRPDYYELKQRVHILQIDNETKQAFGSVKGGAIIYGARYAIDKLQPDFILCNDLKPEFMYYTLGETLEPLLNGDAEAVVCSRWHPFTAAERPGQRWGMSTVYTSIRLLALPEIAHLIDTQAAMKAFCAESLAEVIPISSTGVWEENYDYSLSFDTLNLARLQRASKRIVEAPSVLMGIHPGGAGAHAGNMAKNLFRQRHLLDDCEAREKNALVIIAGGFDLHVLSRDDLSFVIKAPKFETGLWRALLRFAGKVRGTQLQGSPKGGLTHGLLASEWAVKLLDRLGELPPTVLSKIFSLMRLAFSPWPVSLDGYEAAAPRAGGLAPPFQLVTNLPVRVLANREVRLKVIPRAIIQEKVDMSLTIAKQLRRPNLCRDKAEILIRRAVEHQRALWRRGLYNLDVTYYLADTIIDEDGRAWYVDPGDFTDKREDALKSIQDEMGPQIESRVDVQRLRAESQKLADFYLAELRRVFTEENLSKEWETEPPVPVQAPAVDEELKSVSPDLETAESIPQLYQSLLESLVERAAPYIGEEL